jgi:hypothetical protein
MTHKSRNAPFTILVILVTYLSACNPPRNALPRDMLRSDVVEVLVLTDADQVDLTCTMVGTTRTGYCLFEGRIQDEGKECAKPRWKVIIVAGPDSEEAAHIQEGL